MGKLLKIEWLKIRRYRAFIWLLAIFVVSLYGVNYIVSVSTNYMNSMAGPSPATMLLGNFFDFPFVWQTVTYFSSFLLFIPGLIMILLTANEYGFRTHRQSVINGLSRRQFIVGKIGLIVVGSILVTVLVFLVACIFGLRGGSSFSLDGLEYIGYFFIQSLTYMSAGFVVVMIFKRSGVSTGIYFLYCFIIKNMLAALLNHKVHSGTGNYLLIKSADKLIPAPTSVGKAIDFFPSDPVYMLTASVVWIGLCLWFCMYTFEKSDL